ncbi:MAG: ATP-binding protein [Acidobacteriota bacterium]
MDTYKREAFGVLAGRLREKRRFIQVITGPRQVGKTRLSLQLRDEFPGEGLYESADEPTLRDTAWLAQVWENARRLTHEGGRRRRALLILDEIQKVPRWPETVKRLWDEDTRSNTPLQVVLLGSSQLMLQKGLSESLAGRFEVVRLSHWSFSEMRQAFGWDLDTYLYFGGYPGSHDLIKEPIRWRSYILESLIETAISRDILLLARVDKPALLRRMFFLCCESSGQILSYQKMVGQLQDVGNTTTLAHYLDLLQGAGLVAGLAKFSPGRPRLRAASPKLQVLNNALMTAPLQITQEDMRKDPAVWGRLVESAVGAHVVNSAKDAGASVSYWREGGAEVDFVLQSGKTIAALEVKSGLRKQAMPGMRAFYKAYPKARLLKVGEEGIPLEEFLSTPARSWVG